MNAILIIGTFGTVFAMTAVYLFTHQTGGTFAAVVPLMLAWRLTAFLFGEGSANAHPAKTILLASAINGLAAVVATFACTSVAKRFTSGSRMALLCAVLVVLTYLALLLLMPAAEGP